MELTDPAFPHGKNKGYQGGCRKPQSETCPATPTCHEAHAAMMLDWKRTPNDHTGGAKTYFVMRRLDQTIEHAGLDATLARIGMTAEELEDLRSGLGRTMADEVAEQLDQAWSFLVHGSDTRAPDFPHGRHLSYTVGRCRCRPCTDVASGMAKRRKTGRRAPGAVIVEPELVAKIKRHVERLTKVGGVNQIGRAAGTTSCPVRSVLDGNAPTYRTGAKLLAVTPEKVRAAAKDGEQVPCEETVFYLRTMWALGYPLAWQADRVGATKQDVSHLKPGAYVTRGRAAAIAALAREVGDRTAGPESGVDAELASRARAAARRAGWYPPACYDDDRNLIETAIPGHPFSKLDSVAERAVTAVYLASTGIPHTTVAERLHVGKTNLDRDRRNWWGLTYTETDSVTIRAKKPGKRGANKVFDPVASRPRIKEITAIYNAMEAGEIGAVTAALRLGKRFTSMGQNGVGSGALEHPELLAWNAAEQARIAAEAAAATVETVEAQAA